jgi:hypothetical protein
MAAYQVRIPQELLARITPASAEAVAAVGGGIEPTPAVHILLDDPPRRAAGRSRTPVRQTLPNGTSGRGRSPPPPTRSAQPPPGTTYIHAMAVFWPARLLIPLSAAPVTARHIIDWRACRLCRATGDVAINPHRLSHPLGGRLLLRSGGVAASRCRQSERTRAWAVSVMPGTAGAARPRPTVRRAAGRRRRSQQHEGFGLHFLAASEFSDAYHAFDAFALRTPMINPQAMSTRNCRLDEGDNGQLLNRATGKPLRQLRGQRLVGMPPVEAAA